MVGRPVRYWGAETEDDDARAVARMRAALGKAGFDEVVFEYEPVGAAARYAARLDHDELIVVADFGGGTTDFSVMRVGPGEARVLATGGIGVSGDAFDARVIDAVVAPALGRGTRYRDEMGGEAPVPAWLYGHLRRWHLLSFLKEESTQRLLERVARGALEPDRDRRGWCASSTTISGCRCTARSKARRSGCRAPRPIASRSARSTSICRSRAPRSTAGSPRISPRSIACSTTCSRAPASRRADVDRVFATGGSSLVPAVRARLAARFGEAKRRGRRGAHQRRVGPRRAGARGVRIAYAS